jgi:hypothetical protein
MYIRVKEPADFGRRYCHHTTQRTLPRPS